MYDQTLWTERAPFLTMSSRQSYAELLFGQVAWALEEQRSALREAGVLTDKTTAGKITGMFLEGYGEEDLSQLYQDRALLCHAIADAVMILKDAQ